MTVSYRLIRERNALRAKGKSQMNPLMNGLVYRDNPFLAMIKSDNDFTGKYYPVPIIDLGLK